MKIQRGFRDKLDKYADINNDLTVSMSVNGSADYDFCCFGVNEAGKLADDRYMIFYNQTQSPQNEIVYSSSGKSCAYTVRLSKLPANVCRLVFTVSIDGAQTMHDISSHTIEIRQGANTFAEMQLTGADFHSERAVISLEIYKKDVWRFAAVASGFNGGLGDLLREYGGEEASDSPAPAQQTVPSYGSPMPAPGNVPSYGSPMPVPDNVPSYGSPMPVPGNVPSYGSPMPAPGNVPSYGAPTGYAAGSPVQDTAGAYSFPAPTPAAQQPKPKVSLEKKLSTGAPQLVSLAKPLQLELDKRGLQNCTARVALVLDISASMTDRYADGTVQEIVNKALPLAVQFDDDGELDFWIYAKKPRRMPPVNMQNYNYSVPQNWRDVMAELKYSNNEPAVMEEVINEYKRSDIPAYVLFITDGDIELEKPIRKLITKASKMPIFWQFVGVGGYKYGVLEHLDTMDGRFVDNANFFALDDFKSVSSSELYSRLLNEFPAWLTAIRGKGMI